MNQLFKSKRTLKCVTYGRVISLAELNCDSAQLVSRTGFAVLPPILTDMLPKSLPLKLHSPADGVVTSKLDGLTLRMGDGISFTVYLGIDVPFLPALGARVRCGEIICRPPREQLLQNGMQGAIAVLFTEPSAITELHVYSGRRRAGFTAATYIPLPPSHP